MLARRLPHPPARWRDDDGIAIVAAVAVAMVVGMLALTIVSVAVYESRATGRDRARSVAVAAAEARVDRLTATIQSTAPGTLPCGTLTDALTVAADSVDRTATVTYYDATGAVVPCAALATTRLAQASITTTADTGPIVGTQPAERTVETLVRLTPSFGNDLDKAIFGNAGVRLANQANIYGQDGQPDADVYTNGDVTCSNNQHFYGSLYAQGQVRLENTCTVEVDVHARTGITATNPGVTINGRALVSNGSISLGPARLGQQARASGTVTGNVCSTAGKCVGGQTVPAPASATFPIITWNATAQSEWAANGYATVVTFPRTGFPCGWYNGPNLVGRDGQSKSLNGKADGVGAWMYANSWKLTGPTVLVSTCSDKVTLQGVDIALNQNLALFAKAGVTFSNQTNIVSTTGEQRNLYLIQPYDAVTNPGSCGDGIALDNQVSVQNTVDVLMYSPCSIRKANNTEHYGQIYAGGTATIDNRLEMYYQPLPVWGVQSATTAVEYYNLEILYKRENA
ncbi:hypothetical protein GXP71_06910 [Cellulomonas sp. H30R-01]|uniref:hypothetical protein n=1 Tax=Cellulomonas sp. H30R-01 TaxID=2704467 RepID=UPI00138C988E|nr:hypothetical protein [Cellulomonas sp. H30R-01]QHT55836.1 hypothetical protein GXP71_06910 [Cellulomonas sp. H30R-01]